MIDALRNRRFARIILCWAVMLLPFPVGAQATAEAPQPLVIGETFRMHSAILNEERRINVYAPPAYASSPDLRLPVLYMPDGGVAEDFLHVAGLVQVLTGNGTMRPFLLVGIENTERRRDLTGPTEIEEDKKIAVRVGGSANFRAFIRDELIPAIEKRYRTTKERAIVGESLAGLFIVETLLLEPALFDTYIAFDPSLWWNGEKLVKQAGSAAAVHTGTPKRLYLATSSEGSIVAGRRLTKSLSRRDPRKLRVWSHPMPEEKHATIYHPAALRAFRLLFPPEPRP
ncbi:MAG TPA: alpha/beta hydrolase-fold protein [Thermoanaerobaculia bacterium]|nr:alpha/beta hydrolase-fold protein [Thermoanaerobaculia bacterium]